MLVHMYLSSVRRSLMNLQARYQLRPLDSGYANAHRLGSLALLNDRHISHSSPRLLHQKHPYKSPKAMHTNTIVPRSAESVVVMEKADSDHAFRPPNGASRSPCPCLNTLANHSYLPHDGRNITFSMLVSALQKSLGLSRGFAIFMGIGTFALLRRPSLAPFDLHGTARHNFIEHNASMVHADALPGEKYAPCPVDLKLLNEFLAMAHPSTSESSEEMVITMQEVAARRVEREAVSLPLDALHAELGRAEFAMVIEILGKGKDKELDQATLEMFLKENRLPDGWAPSHTMRLWEAVTRSASVRRAMEDIKGRAKQEEVGDHNGGVQEWFKALVKKLAGHESAK